MSAVDDVREFLTMRRINSGLFKEQSHVDLAAWLGFYSSQQSLEWELLNLLPADDADTARSLLETLRNPRGKSADERFNAFCLILGCFAQGGSNLWKEMASLAFMDVPDDENVDGDSDDFDESPLAFCIWILIPCWLVYGMPPASLMQRVSEGGAEAESAAERLVRLDWRVADHPEMQRWVDAAPALSRFRREKLRKWSLRSPFDKEKSETNALRLIAGFVSDVSEYFDERILAPEIRALVASLGAEVPADCHDYLLDRTEDDWSREVRRHRGHFKLVKTKPDKSIIASVRELARRIS